MPARPYTNNTTPDHLGGSTPTPWNRQPGRTTRLSDAERARLEQSRIPLDDPRINDVGGQLSFNNLAKAMVNAQAPQNNPQPPAPPGPGPGPGGGGRRYGGGGGGGGGGLSQAQRQKLFEQYAAKLIGSMGGMWAEEDKLSPIINQAVDRDLKGVKQAFGNVGAQTNNAYRGQQFQATGFNPAISNMMAAQGMGGEFGDIMQAAGQNELNNNAGMWNNLNTQLAANQDASNQAWNQNLRADQGYATAAIEAQRAAMLAAAATRHQDERNAWRDKRIQTVMDLLGTGFESGADVSGLDFLSLLAPPEGFGYVA